ncbi:sigma-54 dependent transcriptional regulator [Rhizobacter sp. J219]|uniref:sigma 54-interacting transcriptional regulator n=1 Tax=Rhizobacter sp. J219 TaxID=2898430 RepID=UPI002151DCA2|nr:sigma-54 dependent transcriptional regulator [Rhizobacter sp. J219]MCR5882312.1 sigma-54 dependent transcriptional regulator [Rhizobacter sp. J219]
MADNKASRELIGNSRAMQMLKQRVERAARFDVAVLIEGETGTGKELVARALHYLSPRCDGPFVPVNCGALPESLIENEFFGHRRGAFTHAVGDSPGLLRLAQGGTLFLDEIDSLPPKGQVMLLRLLEEPVFRPLGADREQRFDIRMLAASNQPLELLAQQGRFRADLLFRLKLIDLRIPPLREREGDVDLLADHFMKSVAQRYHLQAGCLDAVARDWLHSHHWPGNVRELEHWVCRNLLLGETVDAALASPHGAGSSSGEHLRYREARIGALEAFDQRYLRELLGRHRGNITHAAREAGKERRALARLLKRYALDAASFRSGTS